MADDSLRKFSIRFGNRLRIVRRERDISQENLGFDSGLDRTYIVSLEAGRRNPTLRTVCKLAKALGVTVNDLVPDDALDE